MNPVHSQEIIQNSERIEQIDSREKMAIAFYFQGRMTNEVNNSIQSSETNTILITSIGFTNYVFYPVGHVTNTIRTVTGLERRTATGLD